MIPRLARFKDDVYSKKKATVQVFLLKKILSQLRVPFPEINLNQPINIYNLVRILKLVTLPF
jgi:hypothetical protein